jgi:hypothetical protein
MVELVSPRRWVIAGLVLVGLVAGAVVIRHAVADQAPYSAAAVRARVDLQVLAPIDAQAAADRLAGKGRLSVPLPPLGPDAQEIVGQVTFRTPSDAPHEGQYALFVLQDGQPVSAIWGVGPPHTHVGQGWDGRFNEVAAKYSWLRGLASVETEPGFTDAGSAVTFPPDTTGPITFVALRDRDRNPITDPEKDLAVALVFLGDDDDGPVYWATRLTG